jgi:hypothetical protein
MFLAEPGPWLTSGFEEEKSIHTFLYLNRDNYVVYPMEMTALS